MQNKILNNKLTPKPGKTLVIKTNNLIPTDNFTGLVNSTSINGRQFLVFDTVDNSMNVYKILKDTNVKVRYAHYRIFFILNGIDENIEYDQLKKTHMDWIVKNSDANVLYYKQYRKDGKFLGCGDFTIDTKECMDKLLDKEGLKTHSFDSYTGTFYRYNKKTETN